MPLWDEEHLSAQLRTFWDIRSISSREQSPRF
jgi:hypothetical protein